VDGHGLGEAGAPFPIPGSANISTLQPYITVRLGEQIGKNNLMLERSGRKKDTDLFSIHLFLFLPESSI
jgi:hypothetical protein